MSILIYRVETPRGFSVDTSSVKHAISTLKMEELCSSETLVSTYKFQRHCNSRNQHRDCDRNENLRSHVFAHGGTYGL